MREYTAIDHWLINLDRALRTVFGRPHVTGRPNPAEAHRELELSSAERRRSARLMRVNHAGEVCAQALYQGQALTARTGDVRRDLERAAAEENDHLAWCEQRIDELGGHASRLNPLWYLGSMSIGAFAGALGDRLSLGFLAETERQVCRHLEDHLDRLPGKDVKSRAILEQMHADEGRHATTALRAGGAELPRAVKRAMRGASRVMTRTAYWI